MYVCIYVMYRRTHFGATFLNDRKVIQILLPETERTSNVNIYHMLLTTHATKQQNLSQDAHQSRVKGELTHVLPPAVSPTGQATVASFVST
jgi:hypothetical protein